MFQALSGIVLIASWVLREGAFTSTRETHENGPVRVTVCQLLSNPSIYRGKIVVVTGWIYWDRDSFALADENCSTTLRTGRHQWMRAICLRAVEGKSLPLGYSLEAFGSTVYLHQVLLWKNTVRIEASLFGQVDSREQYSAIPLGEGKYSLNGYCHMYQFPARLDYSGVERLTIYYDQQPSETLRPADEKAAQPLGRRQDHR